MLRIIVIQSGSTRIYNTNSFKYGNAKSEFSNFLDIMISVDVSGKKLIMLEDTVTNAKVFIPAATCLIEVKEVADE
nr:MAG TPA: hypothetical protein [Bacteriophage sp.]